MNRTTQHSPLFCEVAYLHMKAPLICQVSKAVIFLR